MFPSETKILVVDDSSFSRNVMKNGLKELGYYKIAEAEDATKAQESLLKEEKAGAPFQLMIADIHMPEINGLELLEWVRSREQTKNLPLILVTTSQDRGHVIKAASLGVSHFMVKPFDVKGLQERLAAVWTRHGQHFMKKT